MSRAVQRFGEYASTMAVVEASDSVRGPILAGAAIIVVGLGSLAAWAAAAPLAGAIHAAGQVAVESGRRAIQHREGGIIKEIAVRERNEVAAGDVLMRLDATEGRARLATTRSQLDAALATRARLAAERERRPTVTWPEELTKRADDRKVRAVLATARDEFRERRATQAGRVEIFRQRVAQLRQQVAGLVAAREAAEKQIAIYRSELAGQRELNAKGYFPKTRILAAEREVARLEGVVGSNQAAIARARDAISEAELQIDQNEQQFREEVAKQRTATEADIRNLEQQLAVAEDFVKRADIRAPVAGVVQGLKHNTIGGVVAPAEVLMEIVPHDDRLVVEAQVRPTDIDVVGDGLSAEIRFPSFKARTTPSITGTVLGVSADRIDDAKSGHSYYLALVEVPDQELAKLGGNQLRAGMPADVMIRTGTRTALDYLTRPISDAVSRAFSGD